MGIAQLLQTKLGAAELSSACEAAVDMWLPDVRQFRRRRSLEQVCALKNISVEVVSDAPFEGRLDRNATGAARITLRRHTLVERMRFTLAHELGHWIVAQALDAEISPTYRGMTAVEAHDEEEVLANALAAEILMPRQEFAEFAAKPLSFEVIAEGASEFDVSRHAFLKRFSDVSTRYIVLLTALPSDFEDRHSPAIVDDAWLFRPNVPALRRRETVRFARRVPFSQLRETTEGIRVVWDGAEEVLSLDAEFGLGKLPRVALCGEARHGIGEGE